MAIKGLKQENDVVFSLNESNGEWEKMNSTLIPQLEALLKRLENMKYPSQNRRESISFEKEFDIGIGSVRSYTDEDGDLVYSFQRDANNSSIHIDEDLEFGINITSAKDSNAELKELKNFWTTEKNAPKSVVEKEMDSKKTDNKNVRRVFDISSISPKKLIKEAELPRTDPKFCIKSIMVPAKASGSCYVFDKRSMPITRTEYRKHFVAYLNDLGRIKKSHGKPSANLSPEPVQISFIRAHSYKSDSRFDLGLILGFMNYNRMEVQDSFGSVFCLKDSRASNTEDDKFDSFLSKIVKT